MGSARRILSWFALLSLATSLSAQQPAVKKFYVVTYIDVFPNFAADAAKQLELFAADSRKDPGSVRFEVMRDVERMNHFTIIEAWETRQAYDAHLALAHTKSFREKSNPGSAARLTNGSTASWNNGVGGKPHDWQRPRDVAP